ncbi:unnamed protein product [Brachionus calyciflorus]|uniref:SH3 domain-containing protein n=1 Tax=Brachionus calyciflorus TaxID=104777 RepID=A0A813M7P0_9BILA|nr:unnamed protein product [Brachionus calyciflorus]
MSQHFKSLIQQIQPLLYNTPFSTIKKHQEEKIDNRKSMKKSRRELQFSNKDSGLDTSSSSSSQKKIKRTSTQNYLTQSPQVCKSCAQKIEQKILIRKKLKKSYINYVNSNLSETQFANIPLIVTKSFRPKNESLNKIQVKKTSAVNALYMIDNKWVYVKTTSEKCGFIPARCCQPFDFVSKCRHLKSVPKIKIPDLPIEKPIEQEHTYISVDQNMYEKLVSYKSEEPKVNEYGHLAEVESNNNSGNQYDCLRNYTPKTIKKIEDDKNYYNNLSEDKSSFCLYKVRKDYRSNFTGGLSVTRGDLVYVVNSTLSNELQALNTQNLVFVRVYRRFLSQQYENLNGMESNLLQGFIPRANLVRLSESNQNSPIYC